MKRGWNSNTIVLGLLLVILTAVGIDLGRKLFTRDPEATAAESGPKPDMTPEFKVGDRAPNFSLPDKDGKSQTLSRLIKGETLLHFSCGCAQCLAMDEYVAKVVKKLGSKAPGVVNVTTMPKERDESWFRDTKLQQINLYEQSKGPVMEQYKGHPCPRYYRLDGRGYVRYIGDSPALQPDPTFQAYGIASDLGLEIPRPGGKDGPKVAPTFNAPPPMPLNSVAPAPGTTGGLGSGASGPPRTAPPGSTSPPTPEPAPGASSR